MENSEERKMKQMESEINGSLGSSVTRTFSSLSGIIHFYGNGEESRLLLY